MPAGGKRPGAGRKPGSATRKTREIAELAAAEGITPLEVMIRAMRHFWQEATKSEVMDSSLLKEAAQIAERCAAYLHPRLAPVGMKIVVPGLEGSLVEQGAAVLRSLAHGELAPDLATLVLQVLSSQAKLIETEDLAARVAALERILAHE